MISNMLNIPRLLSSFITSAIDFMYVIIIAPHSDEHARRVKETMDYVFQPATFEATFPAALYGTVHVGHALYNIRYMAKHDGAFMSAACVTGHVNSLWRVLSTVKPFLHIFSVVKHTQPDAVYTMCSTVHLRSERCFVSRSAVLHGGWVRLPQKEVQRRLLHRCGVQLYKKNVCYDHYSCTCCERF